MLRKVLVSCLLGVLLSVAAVAQAQSEPARRNVIVMIADGAGFNTFAAASMFQGKWDAAKGSSTQIYCGPEWKRLASQTFPLNMSEKPLKTGTQDPALIYDPAKAWDRAAGYEWLMASYTDSAAAATAISAGMKTYNSAINWSDLDEPIEPSMTELAKSLGRATGVVTTVEWSHATPAGFSHAHVPDRDQYEDIARQMLNGDLLDVIMGAGNPDFNNDGLPWRPRKRGAQAEEKPTGEAAKGIAGEVADNREYKYVGGKEVWDAIEAARKTPGGLYQGFRPVSTKAEFEALCEGDPPSKVVGTAQVATTLQQARTKKEALHPDDDTPLNPNVPTLATMARGALNVLSRNPNGFFLMVEGGAVDWASHNNQAHRMIQEQIDFNLAVEEVVQWVEANSSWEETLVIITADHETGFVWGPNSDSEPFQPLVDNGPGKMPGLKYHSKKHTNSLVPVFARGAGSERLGELVVGTDPVYGPYIDNTGIALALQEALTATADCLVPAAEPPLPQAAEPAAAQAQ
ncbi:MAG: alkaline phosphatase [Thermoguttaceae bacterium]|nr:alkaline phosphatase [Thermoguttaceae bacterium]